MLTYPDYHFKHSHQIIGLFFFPLTMMIWWVIWCGNKDDADYVNKLHIPSTKSTQQSQDAETSWSLLPVANLNQEVMSIQKGTSQSEAQSVSILLSSIKLDLESNLAPKLTDRLRFLMKNYTLSSPWHWSSVSDGGESYLTILLSTSSGDFAAKLKLLDSKGQEYYHSLRQRLEFSLERFAEKITQKLKSTFIQISKE